MSLSGFAVSLDYTNGADSITYEEFKQYAELQGLDTTGWEKIGTAADGQELYAFKTTLAPGKRYQCNLLNLSK